MIRSKKMRIILTLSAAALMLLTCVIVLFDDATVQTGKRIGSVVIETEDRWSMSYLSFDGTLRRTLRPSQERISFEIETEKGSIDIEILDNRGNVLFSKTNIETGSFELAVSGKITIKIRADHHSGGFDFQF